MTLSLRASRVEGGVFVVALIVVFVLVAAATFLYLQRTGLLNEYKLNMFSSIGTDNVVLEEEEVPKGGGEDLSIGVIGEEIEEEEPTEPMEEFVLPPREEEEFGGKQYVETAQKGDGITNLTRRAASRYAEEHGIELTAEQKIFVADYAQNRIGDRGLEAGEVMTISEDLIAEGVNKSRELTPEQIEHIENFTELIWEVGFRL